MQARGRLSEMVATSFFIVKNKGMMGKIKKTKKTWKRQLDKLWSDIIRSKGYCEWCGNIGKNAHHVIGRTNYSLRWDIRNGCFLCVSCHFKAHNDPLGFTKFFRKNRYKDYLYLCKKRKEIAHYTISDYEEIYQNLLEVRDEIQKQY